MIRGALLLALAVGRGRARAVAGHPLRRPRPRRGPEVARESARQAVYASLPQGHAPATLPRDSTYQRTVVVLGRDVAVLGSVHGDVIVIGGEPVSAAWRGHHGARHGHRRRRLRVVDRDRRRRHRRLPRFHLRHHSDRQRLFTPLSLVRSTPRSRCSRCPGFYGVRVPSYDRSNGLSLPFVAAISLNRDRLVVEPRVTYRSQLGVVDPGGSVVADVAENDEAARDGRPRHVHERGVDLARSDQQRGDASSAATTRATTSARRARPRRSTVDGSGDRRASSRSSARCGRARATCVPIPTPTAARGASRSPRPRRHASPKSADRRGNDHVDAVRRTARLGRRPGNDARAFAWTANGDTCRHSMRSSTIRCRRHSRQTTLDGAISFPTFGTQTLRFEGHALITLTRQRAAPAMGLRRRRRQPSDHRAALPRRRPAAVPRRALQHPDRAVEGSDARRADHLAARNSRRRRRGPDAALAQATGVRLSMSVVYVEFLVDPARRHGLLGRRTRARPLTSRSVCAASTVGLHSRT